MNNTAGSVTYEHSVLAYYKSGHGHRVLLAFHGFGQDHRVFDGLAASLSDLYTVYVFDLFFHGKSTWAHGEKPLTQDHWKAMLSLFLEENKIDRFSLAGFSLGGKFVLATVALFPERIARIFLLAPDGIKTNVWYSLATYPLVLRSFFKSMISHPYRLTALIKLAHKLRLTDKGLLRFAENQMDTEAKRARVYLSWVVFRHFRFNMAAMARIINAHDIALTLIAGKYDKVIPPGKMDRLLKRLKKADFKILEAGHNDLVWRSVEEFKD